MFRTGAAGMVALVALSSMTAAAPTIWGTEENPELADPPDNVDYSPLYTGAKDRDHVDLLAGWFEFLPHNNTLMFGLKVGSLENVLEETEEWFLLYGFSGNVSNGQEDTATLRYWTQKSSASNSWAKGVRLETGAETGVPVPHGFVRNETTPGYFRWYVSMDYLQNWGVQVAEFRAHAGEERMVAGYVTTAILNRNAAEAEGSFVWEDLEPTPVDATDDDGVLTPRSGQATPTAGSAESVAVGLAASAVALFVGAALVRRRG